MKKINSNINYTDNIYYICRTILIIGLPFTIISALLLNLPHSSATISNSSSDSLSISISSACTLSSSVDSAHTVPVNAGSYTSDIGNTKINAYCNDNNGYSIYAIGSSNNIDGNTDLISNINDNYNIHTGIYDSNSITASSASSWSMKLTAGVGSGINTTPPTINNNYSNYNVVPNVYTLVASRASKTDMTIDTSVTGSYFTTTYDIYASSLQPAGTYTGRVKYLMVHPQSNLTTVPDINTAFAVAGKMKAHEDSNGSYYAMQDMTTDICSLVGANGESASAQLVDIRDNNIYWVTKLKDGHCWMTQNLDLDIDANATLNSNTTDLNAIYSNGQFAEYNSGYTQVDGVIYWEPNSSTLDFVGGNSTRISGWSNSNTAPYSANKTDNTNTSHASLGNYYNWTAAIASNDSSSLTNNTLDDITQNPQNSICPKGWRLPTISSQSEITTGSTNEFARLNYLYNSGLTDTVVVWLNDPLYFVAGGLVDTNATLVSMGTTGCYNSSTISTSRQAYRMCVDSNSASLADGGTWAYRGRGNTVRCVAR